MYKPPFSKPWNKSVAEWEFELGFIWAPTGLHRTLHVLCTHEITAVVISCLFILGRDQMMLIPLATRLSCCSGLTRGGLPWAEGRGSAWRSAQQSRKKERERVVHLPFVRFKSSPCMSSKPALSTEHSCNNTDAGPPSARVSTQPHSDPCPAHLAESRPCTHGQPKFHPCA